MPTEQTPAVPLPTIDQLAEAVGIQPVSVLSYGNPTVTSPTTGKIYPAFELLFMTVQRLSQQQAVLMLNEQTILHAVQVMNNKIEGI